MHSMIKPGFPGPYILTCVNKLSYKCVCVCACARARAPVAPQGATILGRPEPPPVLTGLTVTAVTATSVTLAWAQPASAQPLKYEVWYCALAGPPGPGEGAPCQGLDDYTQVDG